MVRSKHIKGKKYHHHHKTSNKVSAMSVDQCHEQNNAVVKGSGGAIGLTGNPGALRCWMVAGPEIARITTEFEEQAIRGHGGAHDIGHLHHDQKPGVQAAFMKDVRTLIAVFQEMGNPFLENTQDLLVLDTRDIMETPVAETVRRIESLGEKQYTKFVEERLELCTKPVTDTLPKNKLPLFSWSQTKTQLKQQMQLAAVKSDCSLFSRLYIGCQSRDGDLDQFFSHENQAAPPALSTGGKLRLAVKADLLHCLESDQTETTSPPVVDAPILDGAATVQMLKHVAAKIFQEYVNIVFAPYISTQLEKFHRLDLVWDVYLPDSLKGTTRQKRGKGLRKRMAPSTVMPKNWKDFLRVDQNKTELFGFRSREAIRLPIADGNKM